jgi:hypothetical protein
MSKTLSPHGTARTSQAISSIIKTLCYTRAACRPTPTSSSSLYHDFFYLTMTFKGTLPQLFFGQRVTATCSFPILALAAIPPEDLLEISLLG